MREAAAIVIVGAGAAGLMTAIQAARAGACDVLVLDGARKLGAKILIAGGGRCNVTHDVVDESAFAGSSRFAIRNVLRRSDATEGDQLDALSVSISEMRVRVGGATHDLTRGEAEVLATLIHHAPAPVTAVRLSQILNAKRGTIESRIKSLRKKLGPGRLVSRGSLGYQLSV